MHLIPREEGTHARLTEWESERLRARLVDLLSRLFNYEGPGGEPGVTVELVRKGDVGVVLSVLYSPFDEMDLARGYKAPPIDAYFDRLIDLLELVEKDLAERPDARLVRSAAELDACLGEGRSAFVHAVEGGFHLGADPAAIRRNVAELAKRGVGYVTVAHLFWRGVATTAPALPFLPDWLYRLIFHQPRKEGLSEVGRAVVEAMVEHGVLVDVTHMSAASLTDTFELLEARDPERRRSVIASHMACRCGRLAYNLDDETIAKIAERDGVMGVIDCQHYVADGLRRGRRSASFEDSVELICTHIDRIERVTGSFDHAALGSDLDGYIKPALTGIGHMGRMRDLQAALTSRYGEERARKVCSENALRVLRGRWA
jgi:microsomal dipeptidase-like Zn-dependent dipeptidase